MEVRRVSYEKFMELTDGPCKPTLDKINRALPRSKRFIFVSQKKWMIDLELYFENGMELKEYKEDLVEA